MPARCPALLPHRLLAQMLAALFALLAALPALANNIDARLEVEGPVAPGGTVMLAIAMEPRPTWHGYWSNPGDAGFGMSLAWTLPPGFAAGEPRYPVPEPLLIGPLMNHVYEGPYAVLVPLTVPADAVPGSRLPVALEADWLACTDTICVPERGRLQATVTIAAPGSATASDARFARWQRALPAPMLEQGRYAIAGRTLRLAIPVAASSTVEAPHLFAAAHGMVRYGAPQRASRNGDWLVIETEAADDAKAMQPFDAVLRLDREGNGLAVRLVPGAVPAAGAPVGGAAGGAADLPGLGWLLLLALAGGLVLNVMPCVFPILSLKALSLARANAGDARGEALAYTAGVLVAVLALGATMLALRAAGQEVGWAFQLQEPATVVLLLILAAAITANLAGRFEMVLPLRAGAGHAAGSGQAGGAFLTGLLAAFAATPCTGPFMAAAMGAALLLPTLDAMLLFAALGLGLALPFLLIGFVPMLRRLLPRPGGWMVRFRHAMAVPMGLTALALAWLVWRIGGAGLLALALSATALVIALLVITGRRQRLGRAAGAPALAALLVALAAGGAGAAIDTAPPGAAALLPGTQPFDEAALARERASGKPVFVYLTADWCVTCKINEANAIERESTRAAFAEAGVKVLRGDWTRRDPAITRFLAGHGAAGVPLYLWYAPGGEAEILPQVLTADMLASRARRPG